MYSGTRLLLLIAALLTPGLAAHAGEPANLIADGGLEEVRELSIGTDKYVFRALEKGVDLGARGPVVRLPATLGQFAGCKRLLVVEGTPGDQVHSGRRAMLLNGSAYLRSVFQGQRGDTFRVRFFAKGEGTARLILSLRGKSGRQVDQAVPKPVRVRPGFWNAVEHLLDTRDRADFVSVGARLETTGDVLIDDLILTRGGPTAESGGRIEVPIAFAVRCRTAPELDGRAAEKCWQAASRNGPFVRIYDNGSVSEPLTFFHAAFDERNVYLLIDAREPDPEAMEAEKGEHDSWPRGQSLEWFLDTNHNRSSYYQFATDPAGTRFEQFGKKKRDWDTDWQVVVTKGRRGWVAEIAIPFTDVEGGAPEPGQSWGLNVCRNRKGDLSYSSSWAHVGRAFHRPGLLNTLIFGTIDDWWNRQLRLARAAQTKVHRGLAALKAGDKSLRTKLEAAAQRLERLAPPAADLEPNTTAFMAFYDEVHAVREDFQAVADDLEMALAIKSRMPCR